MTSKTTEQQNGPSSEFARILNNALGTACQGSYNSRAVLQARWEQIFLPDDTDKKKYWRLQRIGYTFSAFLWMLVCIPATLVEISFALIYILFNEITAGFPLIMAPLRLLIMVALRLARIILLGFTSPFRTIIKPLLDANDPWAELRGFCMAVTALALFVGFSTSFGGAAPGFLLIAAPFIALLSPYIGAISATIVVSLALTIATVALLNKMLFDGPSKFLQDLWNGEYSDTDSTQRKNNSKKPKNLDDPLSQAAKPDEKDQKTRKTTQQRLNTPSPGPESELTEPQQYPACSSGFSHPMTSPIRPRNDSVYTNNDTNKAQSLVESYENKLDTQMTVASENFPAGFYRLSKQSTKQNNVYDYSVDYYGEKEPLEPQEKAQRSWQITACVYEENVRGIKTINVQEIKTINETTVSTLHPGTR